MRTSATIIADSISHSGDRVTTFEVTGHRFVLAEFNTHRVFSRNSASSRAIPLKKQIDRVYSNPAVPLVWASEQKGMQGGAEVDQKTAEDADDVWRQAAVEARARASILGDLGVHKSIANRLLEPFMWHTIVVTATAYQNFFDQRCSSLAQPEIRAMADLMREAYVESTPTGLRVGDWHLPYIQPEDREQVLGKPEVGPASPNYLNGIEALKAVSAARCARVSYLTQSGVRDMEEDLRLYERLTTANPKHWSPLEHVATPWSENRLDGSEDFFAADGTLVEIPLSNRPKIGNLLGWRSLRTEVEAMEKDDTYR